MQCNCIAVYIYIHIVSHYTIVRLDDMDNSISIIIVLYLYRCMCTL